MPRFVARVSAAALGLGLVIAALPAGAHVSVSSTDAVQGGYGKATFRVPNESDSARTVRLRITLPTDTPFAHVTAGAKPGWKVTVKKAALPTELKVGDFSLIEAVRTVTWTATGDGIGVGEFDEFSISGGPFPEAASVTFEAEQTYSDGNVSDWSQIARDGVEPEKPAPTLELAQRVGDGHGHGATHSDEAGHAGDGDQASEASYVGAWMGGAGLLIALAALVVSLRQNRRRA